jgi:hypothetical protein
MIEQTSVISNEMIDHKTQCHSASRGFFAFIFGPFAVFLIVSFGREDIVELFGLNLRPMPAEVGFFLGFLLAFTFCYSAKGSTSSLTSETLNWFTPEASLEWTVSL